MVEWAYWSLLVLAPDQGLAVDSCHAAEVPLVLHRASATPAVEDPLDYAAAERHLQDVVDVVAAGEVVADRRR